MIWFLTIGVILHATTGSIVPPLFDYDNLTQCRQDYATEAVYCYVKVVTKSDDPFRSIHDRNRLVQQFRRNLLDHAICLPDCEREVAALSYEDQERLYCDEFPVEFLRLYNTMYWRETVEPYQQNYSKLINICVNNRLERRYNLSYHGHSKIEYCLSNEPPTEEETFDVLKLSLFAITSVLLITLLVTNLCDIFGACRSNTIVSSFSIRRNWNQLTQESTSDLHLDFAYIDGIRVLDNFVVITGHAAIVPMYMPIDNPEDAEVCTTKIISRSNTALSAVTVQLFLCISGLLLVVNFLRDVHRRPNLEPGYFRSKIIQRMIRLLPVYYFFLLVSTVVAILPGVEIGPIGYQMLIREQHVCRNNWWINMLLINNLPFYDTQCLMHTWYIGSDLQLFLFGYMVLWMIWKFPKSVKPLFWALAVISIAIPIGIAYHLGLESMMTSRHSFAVFYFMYDAWLREICQPSYTNLNSFIGGMIAGYLYHMSRHGKLNLDNSWLYYLLWGIAVPGFILSIAPVNLFYLFDLPRWASLLHFVFLRNMVVILICLGFIWCFRSPKGSIRRMLSNRLVTTMGKLSYSTYVIHVLVIRFLVNNSAGILHYSDENALSWGLITFGLTYLASVPVYLFIEQPVGLVLRAWLVRRSPSRKPV